MQSSTSTFCPGILTYVELEVIAGVGVLLADAVVALEIDPGLRRRSLGVGTLLLLKAPDFGKIKEGILEARTARGQLISKSSLTIV